MLLKLYESGILFFNIVINSLSVGGVLNGDGTFTTGIHSLVTGLNHINVSKISFVWGTFLLKSKINT